MISTVRDNESAHETCSISVTWVEKDESTEEMDRENRKDFLLGEKAHLAHAASTWLGCAITLLLTYLAQSLREVQHELVCALWIPICHIQTE